jgi:hypothetical protein
MISIIGAVVGLFTSALPELFKWFRTKSDQKHEREMAKMQMEASKQEHTMRLEEIRTEAEKEFDVAEVTALNKRDTLEEKSGYKILDAFLLFITKTVRPTITYALVVMYGLVKAAQYHLALEAAAGNPSQALLAIWNSEDMGMVATVIGYWFGQRTMRWYAERKTA